MSSTIGSFGIFRFLGCAAAWACASLAANSLLASPYSDAVLADSPVAYYRLDETSGTLAANSSAAGSALDGAYQNFGASYTGVATPSTLGLVGPRPATFPGMDSANNAITSGANGLPANGPSAQVAIADSPSISFTGAMTIEAWVKRSSTQASNGNSEGIVAKYLGSNGTSPAPVQRSYCLYYNSRTTGSPAHPIGVGFVLSSSGAFQSGNDLQTTADLPADEWAYLVATYIPGTKMEVYLNGVSVGSKTTSVAASIFDGTADLWIGRQFSINVADNVSFEGGIDEVALYNYALSDNQIMTHYQASAVPEPGAWVLTLFGIATAAAAHRKWVR